MSAPPGSWEVYLARSSDLSRLGLLDATSRHLELVYNRPGTFSGTVPIDSQIALLMQRRSTCVIAERGGDVVWSGAITSIVDDAAARTTQITATGWMEELDHRFVRQGDLDAGLSAAQNTGNTDTSIIGLLVSAVNAQTDAEGATRPTHVYSSDGTSTTTRARRYQVGDNYGQSIRELSNIEDGCDLLFDPLSRTLYCRDNTAFTDQTGVHFSFGADAGSNLESATRADDATAMANRVSVVSQGGVVAAADDPGAIDLAGVMLEEWDSLSDVPDVSIVAAYANAELVYKRYGVTTYQIKPMSAGDVPRLWDDFQLGDKVYFSVDVGRFSVSRQAIRVFSVTIDIDEAGNEIVSELGTTPASD